MIHCNINKIEVLKGKILKQIPFDEVVCYVLIGGNPGGTEGDVFLFVLQDHTLQIFRGNIYYGWITQDDVYTSIPGTNNFWDDVDHREEKHVTGWIALPYVTNHYVFTRDFLAQDIRAYWQHNQAYNVYVKLIKSVYYSCRKHERELFNGIENPSSQDIRENNGENDNLLISIFSVCSIS